jgi:hypothetical protein
MSVAADEAGEPIPALPRRLLDTFFSPGKMAADVARDPKWIGALLIAAALVGLSTALIPPELMAEVQRRTMLAQGATPPPMTPRTLEIIRYFSIVGGTLAIVIIGFLMSGIYTLIFAFILGDEGRYKQYLALFAHAMIIPALMSLPLVPLRIQTGDPQFTLSLGSFMGTFMERGYLLNVFRFMDLTQLWSTAVIALGAHAVDRRRSFGSAFTIMLCVTLGFALIFARFIPT